MSEQPATEAKCPKCGGRILIHPPTGQTACRNPQCCFAHGFPEPPNPASRTEAKYLKLHHKAMLVVTDWLELHECALGRGPTVSDGDTLASLDRLLEMRFEDDEVVGADLLAACEAVVKFEGRGLEMCRAAIAQYKGDQP